MPALAFGLKPGKPQPGIATKPTLKRKAVFEDDQNDDDGNDVFSGLASSTSKSSKLKLKPIANDAADVSEERPRKSPKLSSSASKYNNLSALRTAKLHDEEASKIDTSVYDYDAAYETFNAKPVPKSTDEGSGPKYMTSLMASAETRKRDQLRAREKLLQKERENEGDEFADKEKFVTGAYKKAQEELKRIEEEEKRKEEEEEERRKKGGGMDAFNRSLLKKDEERQRLIEKAAEEAQQRKARGEDGVGDEDKQGDDDDDKTARELNERGARIAINDEGEILDKRQLLGAGLNIAPKKKSEVSQTTPKKQENYGTSNRNNSTHAKDARAGQRERQSRMVERQIEEMTRKQQEAEDADQKAAEEKNKSKISEDAKSSARERFLQRKREKEEEAKKNAAGGGGG